MPTVDKVGIRPESVVKRRGRLDRESAAEPWLWGMREPLRGGVTRDMVPGASSRGERCDRKRRSSMTTRRRSGG